MDVWTAIGYLLLGGILGIVGQGIRIVVGLKKASAEARQGGKRLKDVFDNKRFGVSILIAFLVGLIAGMLGVLDFIGQAINKEFCLTIIGFGYLGTDFIEGLFLNNP